MDLGEGNDIDLGTFIFSLTPSKVAVVDTIRGGSMGN